MNEMINNKNYIFDSTSNVWYRKNYSGINYSDGDEFENKIATVVNQAVDLSIHSVEFLEHCTDWPTLYHLSPSRSNILRPFRGLLAKSRILEIGAGCGAITRFLGEAGGDVLALEGSWRRAGIARSRTRDLQNVTVVCDKFEEFSVHGHLDVISLFGVLEYGSVFSDNESPFLNMLRQVLSYLKPDGTLIIAIENQLGLKYFSGAPEDHTVRTYYGIEGRYRSGQPKTFGRKVINNMLKDAGFSFLQFMAAFPDYKFPVSIVTENGFAATDFDAAALACQSVRRDPQSPRYLSFSPELAWPDIFKNGIALDLANSFLIVASPSENLQNNEQILAYHYSTDRSIQFSKETVFCRDEAGRIKVMYNLLYNYINFDSININKKRIINFSCPSMENYTVGIPFSVEFINIITKDGWNFCEVADYFRKFLEIIRCHAMSFGIVLDTDDVFMGLPGCFFDVVPTNIIIDHGNMAVVIDKEWSLIENIELGFIVFRSILVLLDSLSRIGRHVDSEKMTRLEFVKGVFASLNFDLKDDDCDRYSEQEARIREIVTGRSLPVLLDWGRDLESPMFSTYDALEDRELQISILKKSIAEKNDQVVSLSQIVAERDKQLDVINGVVSELRSNLHSLLNSRSWRITNPLRAGKKSFRGVLRACRELHLLIMPYGYVNALRKVVSILRREGISGVKWRIRHRKYGNFNSQNSLNEVIKKPKKTYTAWVEQYDRLNDNSRQLIRSRIDSMPLKPLISVIMPVFDPPCFFLEKAIMSIKNQLYTNWELCIADDFSKNDDVRNLLKKYADEDGRIRLVFRSENGHISAASNSALELASGEYVAMFDHDDELAEHALYMVAEEINACPDVDFVYSDQDKISEDGVRFDPYFKPDFNPDLLRSQNYVDHLAVFRTSLVRELGGWRSKFDGSQDYDLVLRVVEKTTPSRIKHIPYVLYHWRALPGSLAIDPSSKNYAAKTSRLALSESLKRQKISATVVSEFPNLSIHRVLYDLPVEPLVTIIIPTKNGKDILSKCIDGILNKTDYINFEIIIVDNQSSDNETIAYLKELEFNPKIRIIRYDSKFNYSRMNNLAVSMSRGSILVFLNNDIDVISSEWLREMVSHAVRPEIGAVGARLYYPDDTVQHAGVLLGYKGRAGHMYRYAPRHWLGYWARSVLVQNLTAVTAACMVVRKEIFERVNGFDEDNLTITFNDVDFCLKIHEMGYRNIYTPYAQLYHHESKTRGTQAYESEEIYFEKKWKRILRNDPAYNPNLSLDDEDFSLAFPPRVIHPWSIRDKNFRVGEYPLVSIITRTHGERTGFLKEAISSVFEQSYRPIELIVIEDGTSNARSLVDNLIAPEGVTIVYESVSKRGRCLSGNRGLELSKGEFFGFLDDDDQFLSNHVEVLVQNLCRNFFAPGAYSCAYEIPTEIISHQPLEYVEKTSQVVGRAPFSINSLWQYNYIAIQSFLLRKELFSQYGGFCDQLDCLEDWDLWLRYSINSDFVFVDHITSKFRIPASTSELGARRDQHLSYLPVLRARQLALLDANRNSLCYPRLKAAYESINLS